MAKVGHEPAVTKTQQKLYLDKFTVLVDTLAYWPKIEMDSDGMTLATSHVVSTNTVIEEEVAEFLDTLLLERYPDLLSERYGLKTEGVDGVGVIEGVALRRGFRVRGESSTTERRRTSSCRIIARERRGASAWRRR